MERAIGGCRDIAEGVEPDRNAVSHLICEFIAGLGVRRSAFASSAVPRSVCYPCTRDQPVDIAIPRGAGGTPGGVGQFFLGLAMAVVGGYLLLNQVQVTTSFWTFGRSGGFGLTLLPLLVGVAFLFYDGKSFIGWLLAGLGAAIILASILMHMDIYFRQTTLFNTIVMLGLLFGGLGLLARSLKSA